MRWYKGRVSLGGNTHDAVVTIADIDAPDWIADVSVFRQFDVQPGLFAVALLDGDAAGLRAIGELEYPEGSQVFPYREAPATIHGKTSFSPDLPSS